MAGHEPGVLLLGSDFKALAVARSLGRRGVRVAVVDNVPRSAWFSRYVAQRFRWYEAMCSTSLPDFLLRLAGKAGMQGFVLWPAQDDALELVARNRERLSSAYELITPPWEILRHAHDKRLLHDAADEVGVSHPPTWYPSDERSLHTLPVEFPAIIKPAMSITMQHAIGRKALPVRDMDQLVQSYRLAVAIMPADHVMVQEVIPGEQQYSVGVFAEDGRIAYAMTARRTRQYPIDYGLSSSFVEAVDIPGLMEPAERILRKLGLSGMVEVEFVHDPRDGRPALLDVNPRPWGWHALCIACGLDFPYIQYERVLGRPTPPREPRYGPRWIRLLTDVPAGLQGISAGRFSPGAYLRSLLGGKRVGSVFDMSDPIPAAGDLAVAVVRTVTAAMRGRRPKVPEAPPEPTRQAL
ncbi:MAG TPA: ATP-grasp domain-containing protein [Candidatus Eisenbacteria bacterium]|nr:ATP-grasp domain-containing protein [Candidatus Eisenbacteria bacterium]